MTEAYEIVPCWCSCCDLVSYADILKCCINPTETVEYWDYETGITTTVIATKGYCASCNGGLWDTTPPDFKYDENPPYSRPIHRTRKD